MIIKTISLSKYALDIYHYYLKSNKNPLNFARFVLVFKENNTYKCFKFDISMITGTEQEIRTYYADCLFKFLNNPDNFIDTSALQENPQLIALLISYPAYRNPKLNKQDGEFVRFTKPSNDYKECVFIEGYLNDNIEDFFFSYLRINNNKIQKDSKLAYYNSVTGNCNNLAQTILNKLGLS